MLRPSGALGEKVKTDRSATAVRGERKRETCGGQRGQNGMWDTAGSKDAWDAERMRFSPEGSDVRIVGGRGAATADCSCL